MNKNAYTWAIIAAVILVILVLLALRPDAVEESQQTANEVATTTVSTAAQASARTEAAAELTALRARQEAGETYESLADEYAAVRSRLAAAYQGAEGEAREQWTEVSAEFDTFEAEARAGTSSALDTLARLIASLSADVRTEQPGE